MPNRGRKVIRYFALAFAFMLFAFLFEPLFPLGHWGWGVCAAIFLFTSSRSKPAPRSPWIWMDPSVSTKRPFTSLAFLPVETK